LRTLVSRIFWPMKSSGLLDDTAERDYSRKLKLFNAYAEPELRRAIASLRLTPGMRLLDAGCGAGDALAWLRAEVAPEDLVVGIDLASAHAASARAGADSGTLIVQADLVKPPLVRATFDLVWSVNTVNHLADPAAGVAMLATLLRPGGRIALGQSSLLPDMYFAWNARLERLVTDAVREYYRVRYHLEERDLAGVRSLVGVLRRAKLHDVRAHTFMIERLTPLSQKDEAYLTEAIFLGTWGERLQPFLSDGDYQELRRLCDPQNPEFALRRSDFHFLQTFTLALGKV
jgi:SAM-dependent methyltransferase